MNSASDSVPKERSGRSGTRRDTGHALANQNIAVFIFPAPCLASQALPLKMDSSTHRLSQADQHSSIVLPETPPGLQGHVVISCCVLHATVTGI